MFTKSIITKFINDVLNHIINKFNKWFRIKNDKCENEILRLVDLAKYRIDNWYYIHLMFKDIFKYNELFKRSLSRAHIHSYKQSIDCILYKNKLKYILDQLEKNKAKQI